MSGNVVTIGEQKQASPNFINPYFLSGIIFGIIGTTYFGVHLWLMLSGTITLTPRYSSYKHLHALIQIYLFLGSFILGFTFQAAPRLLNAKNMPSKMWSLVLPWLIFSALLLCLDPLSTYRRMLLALAFIAPALFIFSLLKTASQNNAIEIGSFLLLGLLSLSAGPFIDLTLPYNALLLFWFGIVPIFLATGQQFIAGFIGGKRLGVESAVIIQALFVLGIITVLSTVRDYISLNLSWRIFGASVAVILIIFLSSTKLWRALSKLRTSALAFTFCTGFGWLGLGAIYLFRGPGAADLTLHLWASGFAMPVLFATSLQLFGYMSGKAVFRERILIFLIALWQLVPIARGLPFVFKESFQLAFPASVVATVVIVIWGGKLGAGIIGRVLKT